MKGKKKQAADRIPLYRILPIDRATIKDKENLLAWIVDEFLFIEALLRGPRLITAHRKGQRPAFDTEWIALGVPGQHPRGCDPLGYYSDPLNGTHHALVQNFQPSPPELRAAQAIRGTLLYEDGVKFIDLAAAATRPRNHAIKLGSGYHFGASDGLAESLSYLQSRNPRFLCLCIDVTQTLENIEDHFADLLRERRRQVEKLAGATVSSASPMPKQKNLTTWLDYLKCYDLHYINGKSLEETGKAVYPKVPIESAKARANTAVGRVNKLIKQAELGIQHWPSRIKQ